MWGSQTHTHVQGFSQDEFCCFITRTLISVITHDLMCVIVPVFTREQLEAYTYCCAYCYVLCVVLFGHLPVEEELIVSFCFLSICKERWCICHFVWLRSIFFQVSHISQKRLVSFLHFFSETTFQNFSGAFLLLWVHKMLIKLITITLFSVIFFYSCSLASMFYYKDRLSREEGGQRHGLCIFI